MTGQLPFIKVCDCGRVPKVCVARAAEDAMETWVWCECGLSGEAVEDAYSDPETAVWNWNAGHRRMEAR